METMRAVVLTRRCAAEELRISTFPRPHAPPGWVLVKVRAFGLNHAEKRGRSKLPILACQEFPASNAPAKWPTRQIVLCRLDSGWWP